MRQIFSLSLKFNDILTDPEKQHYPVMPIVGATSGRDMTGFDALCGWLSPEGRCFFSLQTLDSSVISRNGSLT